MAERIARQGLMHYRDADGNLRDAWAGETIQVHPDDVKRFDSLNVEAGESGFVEPEPSHPEAVEAEERDVPKPGPARKTAK